MSSTPKHNRIIACAVTAAALAAPGVAQATDHSIRAALKAAGPTIARDEQAVKTAISQYPATARQLEHALHNEVVALHRLTRTISAESASSTAGARARVDLIDGLGLIARSYTALRADVKLAHGGFVPAAQVRAARLTDRQGRVLLRRGLKVL